MKTSDILLVILIVVVVLFIAIRFFNMGCCVPRLREGFSDLCGRVKDSPCATGQCSRYIKECCSTPAPDSPTPAPDSPTPSPDSPTSSPYSPTSSPYSPTSSPYSPTPNPVSPTSSPYSPTSIPYSPTPNPVSPTPASGKNTYPTLRNPPEKVLWGYWCQNPYTGAVCSGKINTDGNTDFKPGNTEANSIDLLLGSGINLITMFCNIWQPNYTSGEKEVYPGDGEPSGWRKWGTESTHTNNVKVKYDFPPFGNNKDEALANMKILHDKEICILYTIGAWNSIFPRKTCGRLYDDLKRGKGLSCAKDWTNAVVKKFVEYCKKIDEECNNLIDGFDFDLEGFGAGPSLTDNGDWDHNCSGDGGPYSKCYSLPDEGTIEVLNKIVNALKAEEYIVTVVPMSTAMYTNDENANQNQFVKYKFDFKNVDGIMLQWYSGSGLDICGTDKGSNCVSKGDEQCDKLDFEEAKNDESPKRCCGPDSSMNNIWKQKNEPDYGVSADTDSIKKGENITYSQSLEGSWMEGKGYQGHQKCPYKCPRKEDCPDWVYNNVNYTEQVKLLKNLSKIPGLQGEDFSKKIVIGLEAFPNFAGYYNVEQGRTTYTSQNWGPLPSAYAVIGLDNAIKNAGLEHGIGGIGIYTANTAFTKTEIQRGGNDSIYHKLKKWKKDSWKKPESEAES